MTNEESAQVRELKKCNRLLEKENEVLRRAAAYSSQAQLTKAVVEAHHDDPAFGYRLMADEVRAAGIVVSNRTVWARCSQMQIRSVFGQKRDNKPGRPGPPVFDDRSLCQFTADAATRLWFIDRRWLNREALRIAIVTWIERTYHRRRRQDRLGRSTPFEFEAITTPAVTQAA